MAAALSSILPSRVLPPSNGLHRERERKMEQLLTLQIAVQHHTDHKEFW